MNRCASWLLLLGLAAEAGCTVTGVSAGDDPRPRNSCSEDGDCGGGYSCRAGICQTLNGELESILIEASPPGDSSLPHLTFVTHLADLPTSGGNKDIALPAPAQIKGALRLPVSTSCYPAFRDDADNLLNSAADGTIPATVTLGLRQRSLGLSQQVYYAKTGAPGTSSGYSFRTKVPAGEYDVYLVPPRRQSGDTCIAPPQLYRRFPIGLAEDDGGTSSEIIFRMSPVSRLKLIIVWPPSSPSLEGWIADIIEPSGGNSISSQVVLGKPTMQDQMLEYAVPLWYTSVVLGESTVLDSTGELLRLRPPAGTVAPTIYLDRSALGLLQTKPDDDVRLTAFSKLPAKIELWAQLQRQPQLTSVAGTVTFISTEIYGVDRGVFASYQTSFQADPSGIVHLDLPPGKYRVHAEPMSRAGDPSDDERLAAAEAVWDIASDTELQHGKGLELFPLRELAGHSQVPGAVVHAVATVQSTSPFQSAFGDLPLYPRSSSGLVDDKGSFSLLVDPGRFDVTIRAPEELGYGWYVKPGVDVTDQDIDLKGAELRRPSVLTGKATIALQSGTTPLASAAISAYAYLNKDLAYTRDPEQAVAVVRVAETRANADGGFRLLLPAQIVTGAK